MKILHVYNHFYPCVGGIERYVEDLCLELIKVGHRSDVCCLNTCSGSKEKLRPYEIHKGIGIHRIPYKDLRYYKVAPHILKVARKYDLIHIHGLGFFLDLLASTKRLHKKPLILSTHGGIFHTKKIMPAKKIYFNLLARRTLSAIEQVIAVSRNDEKLFSQISRNVVFLPDGIAFKTYSGIKRKPIKGAMVFIGRLSPNKRTDRLIEMIYELKKRGKKYRLYVAGPSIEKEREKLEKMARKGNVSENVKFLGEITEKEKLDLLSKAEFFVSASEYEGFGISVLEAMAAGVPVIVNDIAAFRNFVEDGKNGFIVDFAKAKNICGVLDGIKRYNLREISEKAQKEAKKYDWKALANRIEDIYEKATQMA